MQIVAALRASRTGTDPTRSGYHIQVEPFKWPGTVPGTALSEKSIPPETVRQRVSTEPTAQF